MATIEAAAQRPVNTADVRAGRRPDRRHLGRPAGRLRERRHARHGRHLGRHRRRRRRRSCGCATCSTRRSATTRRWCRWSTSTPSAPAAARSPTSTPAASSASVRSRPAPIPGPACYGRGGDGADLDRRPARCSGGCGRTAACSAAGWQLDVELAATGDGEGRRTSSACRVEEAALGALQIQKFGMTQAIELNSVRRGYDPREFTLVAAGGAGPLFACDIALELEIPRVLVPPHPGIIAATGLLATDLQHEFVATERHALEERSTATGWPRASTSSQRRPTPSSTPTACPTDRAARPAPRRLPLRGPGLRGALRRPRRRGRRGLGRAGSRSLPRRARARSTATASTAEIEIVNIRVVGDRPRSTSSSGPEVEQGDGDPSRGADGRARGRLRRRRQAERRSTPLLRPRAAAARATSIDGPGDHRAVRLDDRHPAGLRRARSTAPATSSSTAPARARRERAAQLATPILMRVIGGAFSAIAKEMAGGALPHVLLVDHPRVRGPRRRASSTRRATSSPSPTRRRCSWARCRRSSRA